jgi:serine/threonine-protein kinase
MVDDGKRGADATLDLPPSDVVAPAAGPLAPGQAIGHFIIRARLGEGGMGVVLACHDPDLNRRVAIKVLKPNADQPSYASRLLREAQAMARLEHRNVLRVYEVGRDRGQLFVAMELVDGITLAEWLRVQSRSSQEIIAMFRQAGAGLAAVHHGGLIHRDFKPDNVLVDETGVARVADFGLARFGADSIASTGSPEVAASLTRTGAVIGTPGYMAPEQQFGSDVDARADQYSYCVALREALFGRSGSPTDASPGRDVPRAVRDVIARGLAYDPSERYASMDELVAALDASTRRRGMRTAYALVALVVAVGTTVAIARVGDHTVLAPVGDDAGARVSQQQTASERVTPRPATPAIVPPTPSMNTAREAAKPPDRRTSTVDNAGSESSERVADRTGSGAVPAIKSPSAPLAGNAPAVPKPGRHELVAAHRAAVLTAIADLGYGGLAFSGNDRDADIRELRSSLATETDPLKRGELLYAIGAGERKRGNCAAAAQPWADAGAALATVAKRPLVHSDDMSLRDRALLFMGRIAFSQALCELAAGRATTAAEPLRVAWLSSSRVPIERTSIEFVQKIVAFETGDVHDLGYALDHVWRQSTGTLRQTIERYAEAVSPSP